MGNPEEKLAILPFSFERIERLDRILVSNLGGSYQLLANEKILTDLISEDFDAIPDTVLQNLIASNMVCSDSEVGTRASILASSLATRYSRNLKHPSLFIIVPTLRCDHSCTYCQVSRVADDAKGYDLDFSTISKIINIIKKCSDHSIKIEFQGGEPLLAFHWIIEFVQSAERSLKDRSVTFVLCSALGPLTPEILDWTKEHNVHFSVSLDGPDLVHNKSRIAKFPDTFSNTIRGIQLIQSNLGQDRVSCLSTTTREALDYPNEIVDEYFALGLPSTFIRPISPYGFATKTAHQEYSVDQFMEFYRECVSRVIELNHDKLFVEELINLHIQKLLHPNESPYVDLQSPAPHALSTLVFNYNGKIFGSDEARMLWESTHAEELVLGNLCSDVGDWAENDALVTLLSDSFITCTPGCDTCAFQPYCGVDPIYHLATQGDHVGNKADSFFCQMEKQLFTFALELLDDPSNNEIIQAWSDR